MSDVLRRRPPTRTLRWVEASVGPGSRIIRVESLGGRWLACHGVDVANRRGDVHRMVLRRWVRPGWHEDDPEFTAQQEARTMQLLAPTGVPAPELVAVDHDGTECDAPAVLTTRLPGRPPNRPADMGSFLRQLAEALPPIHSVDARGMVPDYRRYHAHVHLRLPPGTARRRLWERALSIARARPPQNVTSFIHRDYHPDNSLWSRGRLTGVVDWTAASWGPPEVDVGHMRWNLAGIYSVDVADEFLAVHAAVTGAPFQDQPYWDVVTLFDVLPEIDARSMDELRWAEEYLASVLARL